VIARRLCRHRLQSEVGKTVKKIVAIAALAVALAGAGGAAQAADFVYAQGTGQRFLGISTYDPLGQTFTAGTETELSSFGFQLRLSNVNAANDPITFTLLQGAGFGGTQVATRALSLSSLSTVGQLGWADFDLTGTTLVAGASYTALLNTTSTRYALVFGPNTVSFPSPARPVAGSTDIYTAGRLIATGYNDSVCNNPNYACDANFRFSAEAPTTAPVPEPSTWAMLVGGFGLIGATMRRRLKVSFARDHSDTVTAV
jgi:hypothetical protein